MDICLSHTTALRFWRSAYATALAGPREPFYAADTPDRKRFSLPAALPYAPSIHVIIGADEHQVITVGELSDHVPQISLVEISLLDQIGLLYPVHALTRSNDRRSNKPLIADHVCSAPLPAGAVVRLSSQFRVVSPELLFVQMAEILPFVELVKLGFELCGYYALPMDGKGDYVERRQLTNVASIQQFLDTTSRIRGTQAARVALRYVLDGAASPMETKLAMILTLPFAHGGYNLPKPQMNGNVVLKLKKRNNVRTCDVLWREGHVAVEYDGDEGHAGHVERTRGARRSDELDDLGFTCITITYGRIMDEADMDGVAAKIARHLGYRARPRLANYKQQQKLLRQALLG